MLRDEIQFDQLDKKFFEEFPLIVDVFTSTINKIGQFLQSYYQDLLDLTEQEVSNHSEWSISSKETYSKRHKPFTNQGFKSFLLDGELLPKYELFNYIKIIRGDRKEPINNFYLCCGFYFDYNEFEAKPSIYFSLTKDNSGEKYGGELAKHSFYETFLNNKFKMYIIHPDEGYDGEEFCILIQKLDSHEINEAFVYFKECLVKYFKNINW